MITAIHHPAKFYILYLLSRRQYRVQDVMHQLIRQDFPMPREEWELAALERQIKEAQDNLVFPTNYSPRDPSHVSTMEWLREHRIFDMWARGPDITGAFDILDLPSLRREVEIMLLGPTRYADSARRIAELHGFDPLLLTAAVFRSYAHYFWNVEAMPADKWPNFLYGMQVAEEYVAVQKGPRNTVGAHLSLYVATRGGSGTPKELTMFRHMRDNSFMEFIKVSATRHPGMAKAAAMQSLVSSVIAAQEQVDMRRGGSAELLDELRRMETRYDERQLTYAEELPLASLPANVEADLKKENAS